MSQIVIFYKKLYVVKTANSQSDFPNGKCYAANTHLSRHRFNPISDRRWKCWDCGLRIWSLKKLDREGKS